MDVKEILRRYFGELQECYGEAARAILIIKTAMITYPVLQFYGFCFTNPIAVVVDKINILPMLINELGGYVSDSVSTAITNSELKKLMKNCAFEMFPILYRIHSNTYKNILFLSDILFSGNISGEFQKAIIIAFCGEVPIEYREYIAGRVCFELDTICNLKSKLPSANEFYHYLVECVCTYIQTIELKFKEMKETEEDKIVFQNHSGMEVFYASEKIIEIILELENFSVEEKQEHRFFFRKSLEKMKEEWNLKKPEQEWAKIFLDLLFKKAEEIPDILERDRITGEQVKWIDIYPAFDDKYYYISEKLFEEICVPISQTINLYKLKGLLADAGMLKGEGKNRQYWVVKVPMTNVYGGISNKRKIRLLKEKVDENRNMSWKEVIQKNVMKNITLSNQKDMVFWHKDDWNISEEVVNKHILFIGQSGRGKTVALKKVETKLAMSNKVLVLNFSHTHTFSDKTENVRLINVYDEGIPISLFQILKTKENEKSGLLEILADIFECLAKLGSHQRRILIDSLNFAVKNLSDKCNEMELILSALKNRSKEGAEGILDKIETKLKGVKWGMDNELWELGKISVLDFSGFPESTQFFLSNLVMFILWNQQKSKRAEDREETWISCDEFHLLKMGERSVLTQILREGRKYKMSLLLATQILGNFDRASRNVLLQAGTKFYFSIEDKEIRNELKIMSELSESELDKEVKSFKRGECFAVGEFLIDNDNYPKTEKILRFSFREDKESSEKSDDEGK